MRVTVFDNSDRQLAGDRMVAERDGLEIRLVRGDMADLSVFPDASFDLIIHPVSNCSVPDVRRGTPRIANRLLRRVRDYYMVKEYGRVNPEAAEGHLKCWMWMKWDWTGSTG